MAVDTSDAAVINCSPVASTDNADDCSIADAASEMPVLNVAVAVEVSPRWCLQNGVILQTGQRCGGTMVKRDNKVKAEHTEKVIRFLSDGFNDYIASRVLLLAGLLEQGAVLASTAVEKYFKAMLATHGDEHHGHLQKAHWNAVRNKYPDLFAQLNPSFLKLCQHCYSLRYTQDVPHHFNVVIATREFLAELDHTILLMEHALFRTDGNDKPVQTRYGRMAETKDARLMQENHVLLNLAKEPFIYGAPQLVHELRRIANGVIVEVTYLSVSVPADRSFMRPAFVPKAGDDRSYELSHESLPA